MQQRLLSEAKSLRQQQMMNELITKYLLIFMDLQFVVVLMLRLELYGKLALIYADKDRAFYRTNMVVIRVDSLGNLTDSKPCSQCTKVLKHYGLKKIYYSVPGGLIVESVNNLISIHESYAQKALTKFIN